MLVLAFLFKTLVDFYLIVLVLYSWMFWIGCDPHSSFSQVVIRITSFLIEPLKSYFPQLVVNSVTSLGIAFLLSVLKFVALGSVRNHHLLSFNPLYYLLVGSLSVLKVVGKIAFWIAVIQLLLGWSGQEFDGEDNALRQLSRPFVRILEVLSPIADGTRSTAIAIILGLCLLNYLLSGMFAGIWSCL